MGGWVGSTTKLPFIYLFVSNNKYIYIYIKKYPQLLRLEGWQVALIKCILQGDWAAGEPVRQSQFVCTHTGNR